jgi:hypothetical protein
MAFDWLQRQEALRAASLTIREQARLAENPLDIRWPVLAPLTNTRSIRIREIRPTLDFRPAGAARRAWNADVRELPERHGPTRDLEMIPLGYKKLYGERTQQLMGEQGADTIQADLLTRQGIIRGVDEWATFASDAVYTDLEAEFFAGWFGNVITVMDPASSTTVTVGAGIAGADFHVEPTIWTDVSVNAWDRFIFHALAARKRFKRAVAGVRTRSEVIAQILADSPVNPQGYRMTQREAEGRLSEFGAGTITFVPDDRQYDRLTGPGGDTTPTYYVPDGMLAFQPDDGVVGQTYAAPVVRAYEQLGQNNVRQGRANNVVVIYSEENGGKTLKQEVQMNAISLADPDRVYTVDTLM